MSRRNNNPVVGSGGGGSLRHEANHIIDSLRAELQPGSELEVNDIVEPVAQGQDPPLRASQVRPLAVPPAVGSSGGNGTRQVDSALLQAHAADSSCSLPSTEARKSRQSSVPQVDATVAVTAFSEPAAEGERTLRSSRSRSSSSSGSDSIGDDHSNDIEEGLPMSLPRDFLQLFEERVGQVFDDEAASFTKMALSHLDKASSELAGELLAVAERSDVESGDSKKAGTPSPFSGHSNGTIIGGATTGLTPKASNSAVSWQRIFSNQLSPVDVSLCLDDLIDVLSSVRKKWETVRRNLTSPSASPRAGVSPYTAIGSPRYKHRQYAPSPNSRALRSRINDVEGVAADVELQRLLCHKVDAMLLAPPLVPPPLRRGEASQQSQQRRVHPPTIVTDHRNQLTLPELLEIGRLTGMSAAQRMIVSFCAEKTVQRRKLLASLRHGMQVQLEDLLQGGLRSLNQHTLKVQRELNLALRGFVNSVHTGLQNALYEMRDSVVAALKAEHQEDLQTHAFALEQQSKAALAQKTRALENSLAKESAAALKVLRETSAAQTEAKLLGLKEEARRSLEVEEVQARAEAAKRHKSSMDALSIELDVQRKGRLTQLNQELDKAHSAALDAERADATQTLEATMSRETRDAIVRLDADRARLRAEFEAEHTEALLRADLRLSEEHAERIQAEKVKLEHQNRENLSQQQRAAENALRVALQKQRHENRLKLVSKTQHLRKVLQEAGATAEGSDTTSSLGFGSGKAATSIEVRGADASENKSDKLRAEVEEYFSECERAIDGQASLAQEVLQLRVQVKKLQAELINAHHRSRGWLGATNSFSASDDKNMLSSTEEQNEAGQQTVDWWRNKCRKLAEANDVLAARLDHAFTGSPVKATMNTRWKKRGLR